MFNPRAHQKKVVEYSGGRMGISAVPGSGKTHSLSMLAARLIADGRIAEENGEEVLIVTFSNSAVNNFSNRIDGFIREQGLLPSFGYRIRTLHGLAHDIIREKPDRVGLSNEFQIIDENESEIILNTISQNLLRSHPEWLQHYLNENQNNKTSNWPKMIQAFFVDIARSYIRQAKDLQAQPVDIKEKLDSLNHPEPLMSLCNEIYSEYQKSLSYRSAVDFNDLIRLSLESLESDPDYLARLQDRWPYILEDEAQDSSHLQEKILRLLSSRSGNWVRVGDPNQAIYDTFTSANPLFLRNFLKEKNVTPVELPTSGRSTRSIISIANYLIKWTQNEHPVTEIRDALAMPFIEETEKDDPQPNPIDNPAGIHFHLTKTTPEKELSLICQSLLKWLPDHQDQTVAVLVPTNQRGAELVSDLNRVGIETIELLQTSSETRKTADIIAKVLRCLSDPSSTQKMALLFNSWQNLAALSEEEKKIVQSSHSHLKKCAKPEDFLWPQSGQDWLSTLENSLSEESYDLLVTFRSLIKKWQLAIALPIDQLIITISQDLFLNPADLALAHKIALLLETSSKSHPEWEFQQYCIECEELAGNKRKFLGFSEEDTGFNPELHKGKVVVCTNHKAKGLEWDRVYLSSINNFDFPSVQSFDYYKGEKKFVRDNLNLEAEILAKLKTLVNNKPPVKFQPEGTATFEARYSYSAERLRLFYVAITRAKKELIVTWNDGSNSNCSPSIPMTALSKFWENKQNAIPF